MSTLDTPETHDNSTELPDEVPTLLTPTDLVMVVLVRETQEENPLPTVPLRELHTLINTLARKGIDAVKLFASTAARDPRGTSGAAPDSLMARAIAEVKHAQPAMTVLTETCLCPYTTTSDCHLAHRDGTIDLAGTLEILVAQALVQASAGADVVGPAAMIPESIKMCRDALTDAGYRHVQVMPHLILDSGLYAPYRAAMSAMPVSGARPFQLEPSQSEEAVRLGLQFLSEGADALLLEPALFSADVLVKLRQSTNAPLLPFSVSGEYLTLGPHLLAEEFAMLKRAGASRIVTYAASDLAPAATWSECPSPRPQPRSHPQ